MQFFLFTFFVLNTEYCIYGNTKHRQCDFVGFLLLSFSFHLDWSGKCLRNKTMVPLIPFLCTDMLLCVFVPYSIASLLSELLLCVFTGCVRNSGRRLQLVCVECVLNYSFYVQNSFQLISVLKIFRLIFQCQFQKHE